MSTMFHDKCPNCGSTDMWCGRVHNGIVVDEEHVFGCHLCDWHIDLRSKRANLAFLEQMHAVTPREAMKTSLKLDRTVICTEDSRTFANVNQMWKANPTWMSSGQADRLTATLYAAAKRGEKVSVEINGRSFELVNV